MQMFIGVCVEPAAAVAGRKSPRQAGFAECFDRVVHSGETDGHVVFLRNELMQFLDGGMRDAVAQHVIERLALRRATQVALRKQLASRNGLLVMQRDTWNPLEHRRPN